MQGPFKLGRAEGSHVIRGADKIPVARVYDYKDAKVILKALNEWFERQPIELKEGDLCPEHNLPVRDYVCPYSADVNDVTIWVVGCETCEHEAAMDI